MSCEYLGHLLSLGSDFFIYKLKITITPSLPPPPPAKIVSIIAWKMPTLYFKNSILLIGFELLPQWGAETLAIESKFVWPVSSGDKTKTPVPIKQGCGEGLVKNQQHHEVLFQTETGSLSTHFQRHLWEDCAWNVQRGGGSEGCSKHIPIWGSERRVVCVFF